MALAALFFMMLLTWKFKFLDDLIKIKVRYIADLFFLFLIYSSEFNKTLSLLSSLHWQIKFQSVITALYKAKYLF